MVDLETKAPTQGRWRPWSTESLDWRWWLAVVVTTAAVYFLSWLPLWLIGAVLMETAFDTPFWGFLIGGTWYAAMALVPALVGGVRRWWLLVPAAAMVALSLVPMGGWALGGVPLALAVSAWIARTLQQRAPSTK